MIQYRALTDNQVQRKRQLLSAIAYLYVPVCLIEPATFILNLMLQTLWKISLTWHDNITHLGVWILGQTSIEKPTFKEMAVSQCMRFKK